MEHDRSDRKLLLVEKEDVIAEGESPSDLNYNTLAINWKDLNSINWRQAYPYSTTPEWVPRILWTLYRYSGEFSRKEDIVKAFNDDTGSNYGSTDGSYWSTSIALKNRGMIAKNNGRYVITDEGRRYFEEVVNQSQSGHIGDNIVIKPDIKYDIKPVEKLEEKVTEEIKPNDIIEKLEEKVTEEIKPNDIIEKLEEKPVAKADLKEKSEYLTEHDRAKTSQQIEEIVSFASYLKEDRGVECKDEETTKLRIILKFFSILGWDYHKNEVVPEYSVGGKKVDYLLRYGMKFKVFIEVKKIGEELDKHQGQLLGYAFEEGVDLAILTNGMIWWFYLPRERGSWEDRRFYTIDIIKQDPKDIAIKFTDLLSKINIANGGAIDMANKLYVGRQRNISVNKGLPIAFDRIVSPDNEKFISLLIEETEGECGYRPDQEDAKKFVLKKRKSFGQFNK